MAWSAKLSQPVRLRDGRVLVTLRDAGEFIEAGFNSVRHCLRLERCLETLLTAARTGRAEDRRRATACLEDALGDCYMLADGYRRGPPAPPATDMERRIMAMLRGEPAQV